MGNLTHQKCISNNMWSQVLKAGYLKLKLNPGPITRRAAKKNLNDLRIIEQYFMDL
jgi:hypothetical protein